MVGNTFHSLTSALYLQGGQQVAKKKGGSNRRRGKKGVPQYHASVATAEDNALPVEPTGPTAQEHQALPILLAMARKIEEGEFRHGAGRLTEVWDGQSTIPHLTPHATEQPRRPKRGLEEELEEIVTGVPGTTWEDGETAPKRFRGIGPPLQ